MTRTKRRFRKEAAFFFVAAPRRNYSAMIGRQLELALNRLRRGADYLSPDHAAFRRI
jgi:hypothetical protein